jgi:hypothetical protein
VRPPAGVRPTLVWQPLQAGRPVESAAAKISRWMLENVGVSSGVGPAMVERFSSHAANRQTAAARAKTPMDLRILLRMNEMV